MQNKDTNQVFKIGNTCGKSQGGSIYSIEGIAPCISACTHGWANGYFVVNDGDYKDEEHE